jgi:hypothetical protein
MGYRRAWLMIIMSNDNSELRAYLKNEWGNGRTRLPEGPDCCPDEGIIGTVRTRLRGLAESLRDTYGEIACCL